MPCKGIAYRQPDIRHVKLSCLNFISEHFVHYLLLMSLCALGNLPLGVLGSWRLMKMINRHLPVLVHRFQVKLLFQSKASILQFFVYDVLRLQVKFKPLLLFFICRFVVRVLLLLLLI